jgi:glucose-6-phosphate dehydrogenase assembly protein OpcA
VSTATDGGLLLPEGVDATFDRIEAAMAAARRTPPRALTATVVVIGSAARLQEPSAALAGLGEHGGVRAILISEGASAKPVVRVSDHAVALAGLTPQFLDNAVAALRLSSLPTLVWWRGGSLDALERLAHLADRLVLDVEDPSVVWPRVPALSRMTATSDLRWTRLTRWRALMAHFFDVPEIAAAKFHTLSIESADRHAARLFAGWLKSALGWKDEVRVDLRDSAEGAPLRHVRLSDDGQELALSLVPRGTCVKSAAHIQGHGRASRTVWLGDQSLAALIAEEVRIRSHDNAFEKAVAET